MLLQRLLRVNTVNPPGNETAAAEVLRAYLNEHGVEGELIARTPERANLIARLHGRGDGPSLLFLSHTDTVLADANEWAVDPWSGELKNGEIWGRGALDMKSQAAASAVALAVLAREGFEPAGDVILAAVADEEVGDGFGLSWLCEAHPDAVRADYCINEGGGDRLALSGRALYLCSTAEKVSSPFVLRVFGRGGHASMPRIADNALVKAAKLLERLASFEAKRHLVPETEAFLSAILGKVPELPDALEHVRRLQPRLAAIAEPMLGLAVSPTMIEASQKINVIPAVCEVVCDCRMLPGQGQGEAEREIRGWLGDGDYTFTWLGGVDGGSRSSLETPLWEAVQAFIVAEEPGAELVPMLVPGFTDSHYLREAFGTIAYGFFPMRAMDPELASRLIHSADERIPVDDLELGTRFLIHVARTLRA